ncbi:MAG: A/G-specific adenine glycosylase [Thermoanaerobaculia bacterium]
MQTSSIRKKLQTWYRKQKRKLPWRGTRDPYRIWVSEVMLQQTTVAAVARRYERFLRRFPDLPALARAREESVLAAWSGLGYYARARNLRRAAREILLRHAGHIPREPAQLACLPGFGQYTAAAVASLAFDKSTPAAETNVTRVVSRLFAVEGRASSPRHRQTVLDRARTLLPVRRPGDGTAALMDLGQLICTPSRPACPSCPIRSHCQAYRRGRPEAYPQRPAPTRRVRVALAAVFAGHRGRALLVRRESGFLKGLWEFPSAEGRTAAAARQGLAKRIRPLSLRIVSSRPLATARHAVVNRRIHVEVFGTRLHPKSEIRNPKSEMRWFRPAELSRAAIPTLTRKIARAVGFLD